MEKIQQKACLIQDHQNSFISIICADKNCQQKSKTLCQQCILDVNYNHKTCQTFLEFQDFRCHQLNIRHKNSYNILSIQQDILEYESNMTKEIDSHIDKIYENIGNQIQDLKKNLKLRVLEQYKIVKQEVEEILKKQNENSILVQNLQDYIEKFKENSIDIEELNAQFGKNQQEIVNQTEIQKIIQEKDNIHKIEIVDLKLDLLESQIKQNFNNSQYKGKSDHNNNLMNSSGNSRSSSTKKGNMIKLMPFNSKKNNFIEEKENIYKAQTGICTMRLLNSFEQSEVFSVRFKLDFEKKEEFYIGLTCLDVAMKDSTDFWERYGNDIEISQNKSWRSFESKGGKPINEVYSSGQIYEIEVLVKNSVFRIKDTKGNCIMENTFPLEQYFDHWILIFQLYPGQTLQIL